VEDNDLCTSALWVAISIGLVAEMLKHISYKWHWDLRYCDAPAAVADMTGFYRRWIAAGVSGHLLLAAFPGCHRALRSS
jgi:hypothetical protein